MTSVKQLYVLWGISVNNRKEIIDARDFGYFSDVSKVEEILDKNITDINEAGYYEYALIETKQINCLYPDAYKKPGDIRLFRYSSKKESYIEILDKDERQRTIKNLYSCFPAGVC